MNAARRAGIILGSLCAAALMLAPGFPAQATSFPARAAGFHAKTTSAPAQAASAPAFQIVTSVHYGQQQNASGYSAVVALAPADAWVFGGTNPGGASSPAAEHWDGQRWRASSLPAGLSGFIVAADASSARNVWAVGDGYALRWDGTRWTVAKTWNAGQATSVVAISPQDDWVFGSSGFSGEPGIGAWHFTGRSWTRAAGIADTVYQASAVSDSDIWAITFSPGGGSVLRYDGSDWDPVPTGRALAGTQLGYILAESASSVWVSGISPASGTDGRVVLAHWNGKAWDRFTAPWPVQQAERLASDGAGGIWIPVVSAGSSPQTWILHLSRSGRWTRAEVATRAGPGLGVGDLALVPGTRSLWGAGGVLTAAGGDAVILGGGMSGRLAALNCEGSVRSGRACAPARPRPAPRLGHRRQAGPRSGASPRSGPWSQPGVA